jgi:hypothetical protein
MRSKKGLEDVVKILLWIVLFFVSLVGVYYLIKSLTQT